MCANYPQKLYRNQTWEHDRRNQHHRGNRMCHRCVLTGAAMGCAKLVLPNAVPMITKYSISFAMVHPAQVQHCVLIRIHIIRRQCTMGTVGHSTLICSLAIVRWIAISNTRIPTRSCDKTKTNHKHVIGVIPLQVDDSLAFGTPVCTIYMTAVAQHTYQT